MKSAIRRRAVVTQDRHDHDLAFHFPLLQPLDESEIRSAEPVRGIEDHGRFEGDFSLLLLPQFVTLRTNPLAGRRSIRGIAQQLAAMELSQFAKLQPDVLQKHPRGLVRRPMAFQNVEGIALVGGLKAHHVGRLRFAKPHADLFVHHKEAGNVIVDFLQDALFKKAALHAQGLLNRVWIHREYSVRRFTRWAELLPSAWAHHRAASR
ncbi:hypothetical protein [Chthoniobacter flavus]|uniref:hypothetical protein n=1 Tax=Chthoniobacter flavus TaxID=191863 RepID=UPI0012F82ECF|nr:hypothetical protein [Chthoniobacter flavus]